jgi:nicotinamide mononucleotide transporter
LNLLEAAAACLGLVNIVLLVRRSIWNFPFGLAMVTLYAVIFFEARLYGLAGLQVLFAALQLYGWVLWARAGGREEAVAVRRLGWPARLAWLGFIALGTLGLGVLMARFTDAASPYPDAAITAASIAAQILLAGRRIENWALWIVIDAGAIALYAARDLEITAGLYAVFLVLSVAGLRQWARALANPEIPEECAN